MIRILVACLTLLSSHVTATENVKIYGYDIEASTYVDSSQELRGKNHGGRQAFLTELVRQLMVTLKVTPEIKPIEKVIQPTQLELQPAQAILGIDRTEATENQYKWVGPLLSGSAYFVTRKGSAISIKSINDIRKTSSICVQRDTPQVSALSQMGFDNVELAASYERCWSRVAEGAIDLTTISAVLFPAIKKSVGGAAEKVEMTEARLYEDEVYLAFSNGTPDTIIEKWRLALEQVKASVQYPSLVHHYYCQQNCF